MKWNIEGKDINYKLLIDEKYWWNIKSILKPPKKKIIMYLQMNMKKMYIIYKKKIQRHWENSLSNALKNNKKTFSSVKSFKF